MPPGREPWLWVRTVVVPLAIVIAAAFAMTAVVGFAYASLSLVIGWSKVLASSFCWR